MRWRRSLPLVACAVVFLASEPRAEQARVRVNPSIISAASCSTAHVQAAVDLASDGYTVLIPAGSCTWTSGITVPSGIEITITGAGTPTASSGTIGASVTCQQTVITLNFSSGHLFAVQPTTASSLTRISCIEFKADAGMTDNSAYALIAASGTCVVGDCPDVRFDNLTFDSSLDSKMSDAAGWGVIALDNVYGVLDHNTGDDMDASDPVWFVQFGHSAWDGIGSYGDKSWAEANTFGTEESIFLENNLWGTYWAISETEATGTFAGQTAGGRITVRFNECTGCWTGVSSHGTDSSGRYRGARQHEVYGNNFTCANTASGCPGLVPIRSGVNYAWGNSLAEAVGSWFSSILSLSVFRIDVTWSSPFNQCPGDYDQAGPPAMCTDQPSRSGGTLLSGATPSPTGWTNQSIDPSYVWNNSDVTDAPVFGDVATAYADQLAANRDWFTDAGNGTPQAQTSSSAPFDGTTTCNRGAGNYTCGMGFGTIARLPATCTHDESNSVGVGYFATDEGSWNTSGNGFGNGRLYVCTADDTWTLSYTPYAYPHPLVAS